VKRREVLTLLGGAAAAWPLAARAQQGPMPVIGFLHPSSPENYANRLRGFHRGLKDVGFVEGENLTIRYRWAENQNDRLPELAADLVRQQVRLIVASPGAVPVMAAKTATASIPIPIVFLMSEDPVRLGLIASLARPGGNMTGVNFFNAELNAKRLEILRELVPAAARVAVLVNPSNAINTETALRDVRSAASAMGVQIKVLEARTNREIDEAFASFTRERPDALYVSGDTLFNSRRLQLAILAARHSIPAMYSSRDYPEYGGLISYGTNVTEAYRQVGTYAGRVLKGAKPADEPVIQSSKFELIINHQTARTLALEVPPTLLARADEVIE
jgi:putative tryptophan/tyrosine transport system substrate-binding protein